MSGSTQRAVEEYLAGVSPEMRTALGELRATIRSVLPEETR
jgi:hypothetical protein